MNVPYDEIPYVAFDLDGTLAEADGWKGIENIGHPINKMWERVYEHIANGDTVKIFTARLSYEEEEARFFIKNWLRLWYLPDLEITNIKTHGCRMVYDDRTVQVERNTGELIGRVEDWMMK